MRLLRSKCLVVHDDEDELHEQVEADDGGEDGHDCVDGKRAWRHLVVTARRELVGGRGAAHLRPKRPGQSFTHFEVARLGRVHQY
eukprot:3013893-Prymnesium_polylepis.1